MTYPTYGAAERRVWHLVHGYGIWPGIVACERGWRLTFDPPGLDIKGAVSWHMW